MAPRTELAAPTLEFGLLGSLWVRDRQSQILVGPRKLQLILAVLLIRSNETVSLGQLTNELWGGKVPGRPVAALHVYISQLRKLLTGNDALIQTRTHGYLLSAPPGNLDVHVFAQLMDGGRRLMAEQKHELAAELLDQALQLWLGPPLPLLRDSPIVNAFVTALEERHLLCTEMLVDSKLALGQHHEMVGFLYALTMENPLNETFYRQLMLALYRAGRQADALKVYRAVHDRLRDELGLEPGRSLRAIHQAILLADARLELGR